MAWWSSISSASKLATSALKEAQRKIDKVLAIDDDIPQSGEQGMYCNASGQLGSILFNASNYQNSMTSNTVVAYSFGAFTILLCEYRTRFGAYTVVLSCYGTSISVFLYASSGL